MNRDKNFKMGKSLCLQVVTFFVFILSSFVFASQDPNLVGWWRFDEGGGNIAQDSSGHGNDFTLIINEGYKTDENYVKSEFFVPGVSGYCLQLDGKWQTAYTPHDDILKPAKEMTISLWLRADKLEKPCFIYYKSDGGDYGAAVNMISIEQVSGNYKFRFTLNAGGTRRRMDAPITVAGFADDQWHLYTCTYDGTDMKTYKDAQVIAQLNCPGEIGVCGRNNLYLGSLSNYCPGDNPGVVHYDGLIDDLRIYDKALTQQEIEGLMGLSAGAVNPKPNHGEKSVHPDTTLTWTTSGEAESFDVYFGTDSASVENADNTSDEFMGNQPADNNSFNPGGLDSGVIYYWRVDEVNNYNVIKGHVWNFETVGLVDANLIGWWAFDEEGGNIAFDSSGNANHATIAGYPLREEGVIGNAVLFYGIEEYAAVPNESDFDITGNLTLSAWVKISEHDNSAMYIISKSDSYSIFKDLDSNRLTFTCEGTGMPVMGTINVVDGQWHHVAGVHDGVNNYLYIDGQLDIKRKAYYPPFTNNNPLYIGNDAVWPNKEFNGYIDDARVYNKALSAGDIMALAGVRFSKAYNPDPENRQSYVATNKVLSFEAGNYATSHEIYLGTDYQAVKDANTSSDEFKGSYSSAGYAASLELNTTYYWRVDEVNDTDVWTGDVWSFTTLDEPMDPNLVGYWKLENRSGFKAYDASGNENHGTLGVHSVWSNVNIYDSLYVGSDSKGGVEITKEYPFDIKKEITIATWIWNDGWARWDGSDVIIGKGSTYKIYRNGSGLGVDSTRFKIDGVGQVDTAAETAIADARWHHIAATYDGSTMSLYVDGKLNNTVSKSGAIPTNNQRLWIGNDPETTKDCENAYLREVRVYDRALSAAEISAIALPSTASNPDPADKVDSISDADVTLSWRTGKNSKGQNLYFSSDYHSVNNGQIGSDSFIANLPGDSNSYYVGSLEKGRYYYWRVDQVDGNRTWKGDTWSFYVPLCDGGDLTEDIDRDCIVNLSDFAVMANSWTQAEPDPNAVAMDVSFQCTSQATDTYIRLSLDGVAVGLTVDEQGFAALETGDDAQWLSLPGEPAIPYKTATVLLPADVDMSTVSAEFTDVVYKKAQGSWQVKPVGPMVTWIDGQEVEKWSEGKTIVDGKDVAIYENNELWPAQEIVFTGKGKLRKFNVATIAVPLVQYNPVTGELVRLAMADIAITYSTGMTVNSALLAKADPTGLKRVEALAVNFDQMAQGYDSGIVETSQCGDGPLTGYIIVTTNFVVQNSAEFANFVAHKQARGFDVTVVTETDFGGGSGNTASENIRSWLAANWADDGIADYVLFIGNPDTGSNLPMKMTTVSGYESSPTDFYYATLTGSWDRDGDGIYGESSSDVSDLYYEVMVGRIPFYGSIEDLDHVLAKTIDYECQFAVDTQWRKNTLSAMKPLDSSGTSWALGEDMRINIFNPAGWPYHRIYDMTYLPAGVIPETTPCSVYTVTDVWSSGKFGVMVYSTHGGPTNNAEVMNLDMVGNLNDRYPSLGFAASCTTAHPETRRNLCQSMLINSCIGICGSTRSSWYSPGQTKFNNSGACGGQAYEFYERIVQGMTAGKALYEMKQQQQFSWWENNTILNLYGDPSIRVMPSEPGDLNNDGFFDMLDMAILSRRWLEDRN